MPQSTTSNPFISDNKSFLDELDHTKILTYVVIILASILGLIISVFVVCKVRQIKKKKEEKRKGRRLPIVKRRPRKNFSGVKESPTLERVHPRINQIKNDELFFSRSDSGYTSDSSPRNQRARKLHDSRGILEIQKEADVSSQGTSRDRMSRGVNRHATDYAKHATGEVMAMKQIEKPAKQLSLIDNLNF